MKIGFIGLGMMGRGMAANLQKAGHAFTVHDLNRTAAEPYLENGAGWADTPGALAEACEVVFTSLPRPVDVEAVGAGADGLVAGLKPGSVWVDLSTNSVEVVRRLHAGLAARDVGFLDAPVSGGPAGAASGKLAIWIGGDRAVFDRCQPLLDTMGDQARYIGESGAGTIAKLCHNLTSAILMEAIAEVMTIGVKAGLPPLQLFEAMRAGALGRARTFDVVHRRWLADKLDPPNFQMQFFHKDVRLAVELARQVGVPARLAQLTLEEITEGLNRGWGGRDSQAYLCLQQERAGVPAFGASIEEIEDMMTRS